MKLMSEETRQRVLHFRHELKPQKPTVLRKCLPGNDSLGDRLWRAHAMGRSFPLYAYKDSVFYRLYLLENYDAIDGVIWRDVAPLLKYELA